MKAKDLMIGDWVLVKELDFSNLTNVISEYQHQLRLKDFAEMYNAGEYKKYEPIPLTSEILDKNGIIPDNVFKEWRRINEKYWLIYRDDGNYTMSIRAPHPFDDGHVLHNFAFGIKYVHTLQHFIKELEIEKTITI